LLRVSGIDASDFRCVPIRFFPDKALTQSLHIKPAFADRTIVAANSASRNRKRNESGPGAKQDHAARVVERAPAPVADSVRGYATTRETRRRAGGAKENFPSEILQEDHRRRSARQSGSDGALFRNGRSLHRH
jgi:hypothetical protein